jgi:hypothetical protein
VVEPRHPRNRTPSLEDQAFLERELARPPRKRPPSRIWRVVTSIDRGMQVLVTLVLLFAACIIIVSYVQSRESWMAPPTDEGAPAESSTAVTERTQVPASNVDPAPPAPSLNDPHTPAQGHTGGRPNEREAPPQEVQSVPPAPFGGRQNDHAPAVVEVQREIEQVGPTPAPSLGGRENEHAAPTPKPTFGGKPKK